MSKLLNRKFQMERRAFTLIELLVVISIIALLLSILMPALSRVKEQARNLVCATNLRTLFTAWTLYATDSDNKICSPYTYNTNSTQQCYTDTSSWAWYPTDDSTTGDSIPLAAVPTEEQRHEGVRKGSLYAYADNIKVYACKNKVVDNEKFRSYSIPDSLGGYWARPVAKGGLEIDNYKTLYKVGSITRPGNSFVFIEENDSRAILWDSFVLGGNTVPEDVETAWTWGDPITVRHAGSSSFVFADGHTEFKKWSKDTIYRMEDPLVGQWTQPGTPEGFDDIRWLRDRWPK